MPILQGRWEGVGRELHLLRPDTPVPTGTATPAANRGLGAGPEVRQVDRPDPRGGWGGAGVGAGVPSRSPAQAGALLARGALRPRAWGRGGLLPSRHCGRAR